MTDLSALLLAQLPYLLVIALQMIGFYTMIASANLVKRMIGLGVFQVSVFFMYILMAKVDGGSAPILHEGIITYSNPLPHVLILTAIVVSVATTAVGLALVVRIYRAYGSMDEDELNRLDADEEGRMARRDVEVLQAGPDTESMH